VISNNQLVAEILQNSGCVKDREIGIALAEANQQSLNILDILAQKGYDEQKLLEAVATHCGMDSVMLSENEPPSSAAQLIPAETALRYRVVPIDKTPSGLLVATGNPFDIETLDTLRYVLNSPVKMCTALPGQIDHALKRLYPEAGTSAPDLNANQTQPRLAEKEAIEARMDAESESDEPIIRLVNHLIMEGFRSRASDIHLEPLNQKFRVRYRIDGALREIEGPPRRLHPSVISRIKIMAKMKISEKRLPQDGRIEIRVMDRDLDLRVSSIPTNHGESIVLRILDRKSLTPGLQNLGFYSDDQASFERIIRHPNGILLITGPTGSGKTTTLYACLNHLNQPDRKIITVEDPVEYQLPGVNQVHVRPEIGLSFAAALRSILRQAPNVIMIGEIRDQETADIAINASLTGHLVLSTLHTNDAPSAITRLTDIGVKPFLISSALRGVVAQRLVRTICEDCKTSHAPTPAESRLLTTSGPLFKGSGCPSCGHTGYLGRKGIFELLPVDDDVQQMIYSGIPTTELRAKARALGMRTLREDGLRKATEGLTTLNEVLRVTMGDRN
jgi:general secretion pathway protein E/type IV pilus assembly protein PilB